MMFIASEERIISKRDNEAKRNTIKNNSEKRYSGTTAETKKKQYYWNLLNFVKVIFDVASSVCYVCSYTDDHTWHQYSLESWKK